MSDKLMTPEVQAEHDYHDGQGQSANPYEYSTDENSDYKKYEWKMHSLWSRSFDQVCNDVLGRTT